MSEPVLGVAPVPGLDITGVIYRYTAVKHRADPFTVSVQNENAVDGGYIFRETDDWTGKSGQTITKAVPTGYSPIELWGPGSIETTGVGSVEDPAVVYTYRFDPSVQTPEIQLPDLNIEVYSALDDPYAQTAEVDRDKFLKDDEEVSKDDDESSEKEMEKALATADTDLSLAAGQAALLAAMNSVLITSYYAKTIPGGTYNDAVVLVDSKLPDNRRAFRSMANDQLHTEMVGSQWK
jgi:hypothetical protein